MSHYCAESYWPDLKATHACGPHQCLLCKDYQSGNAKPNYPVPAIRYDSGLVDVPDAHGNVCTVIFATFFDTLEGSWQIII
jgi:hypothetical protein